MASTVAVKSPQFWPDKARLWFVQAVALFTLGKITAEKTKFAYVAHWEIWAEFISES